LEIFLPDSLKEDFVLPADVRGADGQHRVGMCGHPNTHDGESAGFREENCPAARVSLIVS